MPTPDADRSPPGGHMAMSIRDVFNRFVTNLGNRVENSIPAVPLRAKPGHERSLSCAFRAGRPRIVHIRARKVGGGRFSPLACAQASIG